MNKKMKSMLLAALAGAAIAPAQAGLLTYQGVTFNSSWSGNVLTLQIDAAKPTDDWSKAIGLAALEIDGIGNYGSVSVTSAPGGTGSWLTSSSELTGQGCDGGTNGQAGSRLCFYGQQIGLADKMLFSFTFSGNDVKAVDPHLKVEFVDTTGKKSGTLLSQTLPATPADTSGAPLQTGSETGGGASSAQVPEPQGIAVLLAGLGLMALVARRKRR